MINSKEIGTKLISYFCMLFIKTNNNNNNNNNNNEITMT